MTVVNAMDLAEARLRKRTAVLLDQVMGCGAMELLDTDQGRAAVDIYVQAAMALRARTQMFAGLPEQARDIADAADDYINAFAGVQAATKAEVERRLLSEA